ncbi:hypothetical protein [Rubellimicrobium aerolatum]|uniref:Uncharacterized protein n=1 Tax=Rubellimicrobium aerolatum TaxID=490979 RepID=A0ABW0SF52_9RHOB|nr:hypothetical protein [Rubellimicrobium aerolatum]MBP1807051.1 hypothetical protein [Rubellimicrobium aerolatum]
MTSTALSTPRRIDPATVNGWGVDADPRNDPTYPLRERDGDSGPAKTWERPVQQRPDVEVLMSIEHNRLPAVVGTSTPPSGLSGAMRRAAFRYSESDWTHWLILLGADRVNMVEGVLSDLAQGRVPNIPAEMGVRAAWRHDRAGLVTRTAAAVAVGAVAYALLRRRRDDDRPRRA